MYKYHLVRRLNLIEIQNDQIGGKSRKDHPQKNWQNTNLGKIQHQAQNLDDRIGHKEFGKLLLIFLHF